MEARFGQGFAGVRIHADEPAAKSAEALGARAYTVGRDIVFAAHRYVPASRDGKRLLAHELAHVVQQGRGGAAPDARGDAQLEADAGQAAAGVVQQQSGVTVAGASGVGLALEEDPDKKPGRLDRLYSAFRASPLVPQTAKDTVQAANEALKQKIDHLDPTGQLRETVKDKVVQAVGEQRIEAVQRTLRGPAAPRAKSPAPVPKLPAPKRKPDLPDKPVAQLEQQPLRDKIDAVEGWLANRPVDNADTREMAELLLTLHDEERRRAANMSQPNRSRPLKQQMERAERLDAIDPLLKDVRPEGAPEPADGTAPRSEEKEGASVALPGTLEDYRDDENYIDQFAEIIYFGLSRTLHLTYRNGAELIFPIASLRAGSMLAGKSSEAAAAAPSRTARMDVFFIKNGVIQPSTIDRRTAANLFAWVSANKENIDANDLFAQEAVVAGTMGMSDGDVKEAAAVTGGRITAQVLLTLLMSRRRSGVGRGALLRGAGKSAGGHGGLELDLAPPSVRPAPPFHEIDLGPPPTGSLKLDRSAPPTRGSTHGELDLGPTPPVTPDLMKPGATGHAATPGPRQPLLLTEGEIPLITPPSRRLSPPQRFGVEAEGPMALKHGEVTLPRAYPAYDTIVEGPRGSTFKLTNERINKKDAVVVNQTVHGGEWSSKKTVLEAKNATPEHIRSVVEGALDDIANKRGAKRDPVPVDEGVYWRVMEAEPDSVLIHVRVPREASNTVPTLQQAAEMAAASVDFGPGMPPVRVRVDAQP